MERNKLAEINRTNTRSKKKTLKVVQSCITEGYPAEHPKTDLARVCKSIVKVSTLKHLNLFQQINCEHTTNYTKPE
jgi:hypothetical protein